MLTAKLSAAATRAGVDGSFKTALCAHIASKLVQAANYPAAAPGTCCQPRHASQAAAHGARLLTALRGSSEEPGSRRSQ